MATLLSEDTDCVSKLELTGLEMKILSGGYGENQDWQNVSLKLTSGARSFETIESEDVMLCRRPQDEVAALIDLLLILVNKERDDVLFEPSEPSFEFSLTRTRRGGIKVEAWIDSGNGSTGIYTWDACGARFYTTDDNLRQFIDQLKAEFKS